MKGKFLVCEEKKTSLLLVQVSPIKGVLPAYNPILSNALICAFFTIFGECDVSVEDLEIGYDGWITNKQYEDFSISNILEKYIKENPELWFCKTIKEQE